MGTIEIHEPEIKEANPANRPSPAVLPKSDLGRGLAMPKAMFSDSLLEFGKQNKRHALATTTSFILNCMAVGAMLLAPLMFTDTLPKAQLLILLVAPPPPPPPPPPAAEAVQRVVHRIQTDLLITGQLRTPSRIPQRVQMIHEEDSPPPVAATGGVVGGVPGGIPGGQLGGRDWWHCQRYVESRVGSQTTAGSAATCADLSGRDPRLAAPPRGAFISTAGAGGTCAGRCSSHSCHQPRWRNRES